MFATPSVYMQPRGSSSGGLLQAVLLLNPMTPLIAAFRAACPGRADCLGQVGIATVVVLVLFLAGCFYFRKVEDNFADII